MKPLHHKTHPLAKRGLSLLCVLALCLGLLPTTALAAAPSGQELYVGGMQISSTGYWTTDSDGNVTSAGETQPGNNYIYYNANENILTLHNATIKKGLAYDQNTPAGSTIHGSAIGVLNQSGDAELTVQLEGSNTIDEVSTGIYVHSSGGGAALSITGNGTLVIDSTFCPIQVISFNGNAALSIENAKVTATSSYYNGVTVQSGSSETSSASLTVNGGSLTATASSENVSGISLSVGADGTGDCTPTVTVSNNAIVRANGSAGGITSNSSTGVQYRTGSSTTGGIVFDGNTGTVYGAVTLDENLTISEGESLTIGKDASLTVPSGTTLTNDGTVTTEEGGTMTNNGTIDNSGTLPDSIEGSQPPKITTASLPNGEVDKNYSQTLAADNNPTSWNITNGALPDGLTLNEGSSTISGIPATANTYKFTVTATNDSGSDSKEYTIQIEAKSDTTPPTLTAGTVNRTSDTDATVTFTSDEAGTYFYEVVDSGEGAPTDITSGTSYTLTNDTNTITLANLTAGAKDIYIIAKDAAGNQSATLKIEIPTYVEPVYSISADTTALNFGSAYTGYAQPAAQTVTVKNTGNQRVTVTLPTSTNYIITAGTNFENGTAILAPNDTATFTVQPKAGLSAGTYSDTITVSDTNNNVTLSITASFTVKSRPSYNPPTVSEETIDAIKAADPGETVTVDLSSGSTKLDKEVFETLAGKDVTLVVDLGGGVSWTVKGSDIPEDADFTDIDMGVTMNSDGIPVEVVNAITGERDSVQLELAHDGAFGFTMTLTAPLGAENAGLWANLYYFNESTNKMTFETAVPIGSDGSVSLALNHASQYAIVIDDHNHGVVTLPFTDVSAGDWFYDPVCYVYSQGLMTGTSATTFEPNTSLSRAMLVAVLHRLEGSPAASAGDFTDVADGDWYAQAVNWAASVGVVNGFDDGTFQPNAAITREQLAAILRNYAQYKGMDVTATGSLTHYTDAASVSDWAKDSVAWAVDQGLISGITVDTLQPQSLSTRAQVAAVLQRYLEK